MSQDVSLAELISSNIVYLAAGLLVAFVLLGDIPSIGSRYKRLPGAKVVGAAFSFEPSWLTRYRFTLSGWSVIENGCRQVQSGLFTVIRPESNVTVIPRKYIDELSSISDDKLAASESIVNDMMGHYTRADIMLGSHLGHHAVKNKLTPKLALLVSIIEEELLIAAKEDPLPVTSEWSEQKLWPYTSKLLARITSRLFVGIPLCRSEEWLRHNSELVKAIFETAVVMRNLPRFLHPIIGYIIPSRRRLLAEIKQLHQFLIPLIEERRTRERTEGTSYEKPQDVMQWMMDLANESESPPDNLATRFMYTILGSVQTVVEVILNCIYELCIRPEYIEPLRQEMESVLREENGWSKQAAARMVKTDSFMKEIFRHYPPSALAFRRITKDQLILSDGLVLPKNTYICIATTSPSQDDMEDSDTDQAQFNGFRYHQKRLAAHAHAHAQTTPSSSSRHDYATTDKSHISFGHGRYACPGRFAASIEIKMVLAHVLLRYDVKLADGVKDRPRAMRVLEFQFLDPEDTVLVRRRLRGVGAAG